MAKKSTVGDTVVTEQVVEEVKEETKTSPGKENVSRQERDQITRELRKEYDRKLKILGNAVISLSNARNDLVSGLETLLKTGAKDTVILQGTTLGNETISILQELKLLPSPTTDEKK